VRFHRPFILTPFSPPLSFPTSPLSHFTPPLPFPQEVHKTLSYRGQNALSVMKTRTQYRQRSHCIYPYASLDWPDGRIMFSTCPVVRPSAIILFVCYDIVNTIGTTSQTNEPISMQIGTYLPLGQMHEQSTSGVRRSKFKVTLGRSYIWKPGGDIILDPLSRVDRGMQ